MRFASESCIQELLSASDSNRGSGNCDGWKVLALENGVEISKRRSGSLHTFRSRWLLRSLSPQQFITVANAIDAAKVNLKNQSILPSSILLLLITSKSLSPQRISPFLIAQINHDFYRVCLAFKLFEYILTVNKT